MSVVDVGPFSVTVLDRRGPPVHHDNETTLDVSMHPHWGYARWFVREIVPGVELPERWPSTDGDHSLTVQHDDRIIVIVCKGQRACIGIPAKEATP